MALCGWRWETCYSWSFTYPLRWNQDSPLNRMNVWLVSLTCTQWRHPVYGLSHMYAHATDVLHILLKMYTNLWCANWANNMVADDFNPTPISISFSLTCIFFTSLTICSDTCRLKPFHATVNCFHVWKNHITKLLSEFTLLLVVKCIWCMHCIHIYILTAGDSHVITSPLEWVGERA